jgi:hypothetical protein
MAYEPVPTFSERAWLFHRGRWSKIKNPLYQHDAYHHTDQHLQDLLQDYDHQWWTLGPVFLLPHYSGLLIYTYRRNEETKGPEYLVWIDAIEGSEILFVHDLPDLLDILSLLTPMVNLGILVDAYRRSADRYRQGGNHRQDQ